MLLLLVVGLLLIVIARNIILRVLICIVAVISVILPSCGRLLLVVLLLIVILVVILLAVVILLLINVSKLLQLAVLIPGIKQPSTTYGWMTAARACVRSNKETFVILVGVELVFNLLHYLVNCLFMFLINLHPLHDLIVI